jgi:glucosamine--fructose-6-phosphate aminotransferase (isomerizing)
MAGEAALKLQETCLLQAAAYSSAEVLHGPVSIVGPGFPALALAVDDAAGPSVAAVAADLAAKGATVFSTRDAAGAVVLPAPPPVHPLLDPLPLIAAFYAVAERAAHARGIDPDAPRHLSKVTRTT